MVHESFSKRTDVVKQYNTDRESRTISKLHFSNLAVHSVNYPFFSYLSPPSSSHRLFSEHSHNEGPL